MTDEEIREEWNSHGGGVYDDIATVAMVEERYFKFRRYLESKVTLQEVMHRLPTQADQGITP
jgi:hypothetical protein